MALARVYTTVDVQAALDLAEGHKFSSFSMVWGGNDSHFKTVEHKDKTGAVRAVTQKYQPGPEAETVSDDEGHTKRNHVKGFQGSAYEGQKSRFDDLPTCLAATAEVLNSAKGQAVLQAMDADASIRDRKIRADVTGDWYGDKGDGVKKKIADVTVIVMRLGSDTLWLHTSYPTGFVA
jgi:hypothetical protein